MNGTCRYSGTDIKKCFLLISIRITVFGENNGLVGHIFGWGNRGDIILFFIGASGEIFSHFFYKHAGTRPGKAGPLNGMQKC